MHGPNKLSIFGVALFCEGISVVDSMRLYPILSRHYTHVFIVNVLLEMTHRSCEPAASSDASTNYILHYHKFLLAP